MKKRVHLIHRVTNNEWGQLLYIQLVCRAITRYSGWHWDQQYYEGWKEIYLEHRERLKHLSKTDIRELNKHIVNNNLDLSSYRLRDIIEMERLPLRVIE